MPKTSLSPSQMRLGSHVCSIEGGVLGSVAAVAADSFLLERNSTAIWLPFDVVFIVEDFTVTLICDFHGVNRYAIPAPAPHPEEEG